MDPVNTHNNTDFHCFSDPAEWEVTFSYRLNGPSLFVVIVIGLVGNILCLLTLNRPKNRLPQINQYLIALGLWDTGLIVSAFFVYNLPYLLYGRIVTHGAYVLAYPLCYMLSSASYMGSIWMVLISAIDRYFALCRPLAHRYYMGDKNRTKTVLISCSLVCLVYNIPKYLEMSIDECYDTLTKAWLPTVTSSGLRMNRVYWISYKITGGLLFYSAVPFAALSYFSIRVYYEVRRMTSTQSVPARTTTTTRTRGGTWHTPSPSASAPTPPSLMPPAHVGGGDSAENGKRVSFCEIVSEYQSRNGKFRASSILRRHSTSRADGRARSDDPQQALNSMLVAVLLKFLACHSLPTVLDMWESSTPRTEEFTGPVIDILVDASNFLVVVNSSVNIFIYLWCSRRFRMDMRMILARMLPACIAQRYDTDIISIRGTNGNQERRNGSCSHIYIRQWSGHPSPSTSLMTQ